ncbi:hypothetical protein [Yinghuangia sp. YIM S10712]|uniref:hypothetical protein n=1 Tax=Yinghuangia sp. YIM S10712 TaxID=3436930 RepID=UPI003F52FA5B
MTTRRTAPAHRVTGPVRTGYTGDPTRPVFVEVDVEGHAEPVRLLLDFDQAEDADLGLYSLRPSVAGEEHRAPVA